MLKLAVAAALLAAAAAAPAAAVLRERDPAARAAQVAAAYGGAAAFDTLSSSKLDNDFYCLGATAHRATYTNVTLPPQNAFVRLDAQPGFAGVDCSVDHTALRVSFGSAAQAQAFARTVAAAGDGGAILTGAQGAAECEDGFGMFRRVAMVNSADNNNHAAADNNGNNGTKKVPALRVDGAVAHVRVFKAAYDTTLKSGTVGFGAAPIDDPAHAACRRAFAAAKSGSQQQQVGDPATFCMGVNVNDGCTGPKQSITLFQNQYVSVTCPECYLAFDMTVGIKLRMEDFLLYDSELIMTDLKATGDLQALLNAQASWGVNGDETIPIISPRNVIQFWVGPLPVTIGFELPLVKTAHASLDATAHAQVGAEITWELGHFDINWDPILGFTKHVSTPVVTYDTKVSGQAQFNGNAAFGLAPSLSMHVDDFVKATVGFSSQVQAQIEGNTASMEICASGSYECKADGEAELYISIPWTGIDKSWTWQETWFDIKGDLKQKCVGAKNLSIPEQQQPSAGPRPGTVDVARPVAVEQRSNERFLMPQVGDDATKLVRHTGSAKGCVMGRPVRATYDASVSADYNFVDLSASQRIKKLDCNAGENKLRITFERDHDKDRVRDSMHDMSTFLTTSSPDLLAPGCAGMDKRVFLYRVLQVTDTSIPLIHYQLDVWVAPAKYDEIFANATISLGRDWSETAAACGGQEEELASPEHGATLGGGDGAGSLGGGASKHVCLGVNTNEGCTAAKAPIPLFSSEYINVDCANCYAALNADIFFSMNLSDFTLHELQGGFQDISFNAALIAKATSQKAWNAGTQTVKSVVPPTTILSFAVGPVPIRLWFEIPLDIDSNVQAQYAASFSAGVDAVAPIGDFYVQWKEGDGWSAVHPTHLPKLQLTPQISAPQAQFTASGSLSITPSFSFHVDSVFGTTFTLNPQADFNLNATLATKKACLASTAQVTATGSAYLDVNVGWVHAGGDWPKTTLFDTGVINIEDKCITF